MATKPAGALPIKNKGISDLPKEKTLKQKMAQSVAGSAPSMVPVPYVKQGEVPEAPGVEDVIPSINDLIGDDEDRDTLSKLIAQRIMVDAALQPLEKQKDVLTDRIKTQLSSYGITSMVCDGAKVSYTVTERKTLNQMKLIEAGVAIDTIVQCTDISKSSSLRITPAKE